MRAHRLADEIDIDRLDLEALDSFLMSDRSPPESMMLSDLDGFLTGIAIGPELLLPSEWLPLIWGGQAPEFADEAEANAILGSIMARYNEILRQITDDTYEPIFWADRDGTLIAADWAEGFLEAIAMRADAWERLFNSKRDSRLLYPILLLCGDENGESLLGLPPGRRRSRDGAGRRVYPGQRHRHRRLLAYKRANGGASIPVGPGLKQGRPQRPLSLRLR